MAMQAHTADDEIVSDINTTPLIDVMLVLLVILIITLPLATHAVKLDMATSAPRGAPPPAVDLQVDFDGSMLWNGAPVNAEALRTHFAAVEQMRSQPDIRLSADRLTKYQTVATILADAQRLGVARIGIVNTQEFAN